MDEEKGVEQTRKPNSFRYSKQFQIRPVIGIYSN